MPATSRWIKFDASADTLITAQSSNVISGSGEFGYAISSSFVPSGISIIQGVADRMRVKVDGDSSFREIQLTSGSNIDPRVVARDICFKIKQLPYSQYDAVTVEYVNNKFKINSSSLGTSSAVAIAAGTSADCTSLLSMNPATTQAGSAGSNNAAYTGQLSLSGVYKGQFDDIYTIMIGTSHPVGEAVPSGTNSYNSAGGVVTTAGDWNEAGNDTYTITISTANGAVMNNGTNNVPTIQWTSVSGDNSTAPVELLFSDYWYNIGVKGLRIKFSDAPFANNDKFNITCTAIAYAAGSSTASGVGSAQYVWSSLREGKSSSATTTQVTGTAVGTKGVTVAFSNSGLLTRGDEFRIFCSGPQPTTIGATVLNFGSVTVSTYSPTQVVWFELTSGATVLSSPKFGLQSHGTAQHHNAGNADTKFAFGTAGNGNPASDYTEWKKGIVGSTDLASDTPPSYLAATEDNMPVVSTADQSISVGVAHGEMVSDFIYLAIKLGSVETGANPSIVWRMFFDYA